VVPSPSPRPERWVWGGGWGEVTCQLPSFVVSMSGKGVATMDVLSSLPPEVFDLIGTRLEAPDVNALVRTSTATRAWAREHLCTTDACFRPVPPDGSVPDAVAERFAACAGVNNDPARLAARLVAGQRSTIATTRLAGCRTASEVWTMLANGGAATRLDDRGHGVLHNIGRDGPHSHEVVRALCDAGADPSVVPEFCTCGSPLAVNLRERQMGVALAILDCGGRADLLAIREAIDLVEEAPQWNPC
jgi:hypothetical protein